MIAIEDDACGVVVVYLRTCLAVGEEGVHAVELSIEGYGVLAWRGEVEVGELQQRLQVLDG